MAKLVNNARMTTTTTGTGTLTLGTAVAGCQSFADAGVSDGDTVSYGIADGTAWEVGRGVYTADGTTLSRGVLESSDSDSAINLSGDAEVYVTVLAEDISGGDSNYTAAYASRPAAGNNGDIFLPSDGFTVERDTGAAWVPWGPLHPLTPPVLSEFAWINQGTASATQTKGGIYLYDTSDSTTGLRILKKSAPATPYTITAAFVVVQKMITNEGAGLIFRQSSDGKCVNFFYNYNSTIFNVRTSVHKYASPTSWNASYYESNASTYMRSLIFFRIADNGTSRICSISADGQNFIVFHTIGRTDYLTADEVGFAITMSGTGSAVGMTLLSWKEE